jgi:MFS transporter, DHA2 family, multidrug resistance protein
VTCTTDTHPAVVGATPAPPPAAARPASAEAARTRWPAVATLALGTMLVASELTMAAMALPLIGADLGVSAGATAWVLLAYSLPLGALAIPAGRWVDRADLRTAFTVALVGIALASLLAVVAPNFWTLLLARGLQGVAAGTYLAVYLPVISVAVREEQRGRAISYVTTIMMIGSMAVTPLGGFVAEALGWRELFAVKVPMLVLIAWVGHRTIPAGESRPLRLRLPVPDRSLLRDVALVGAAVTALLFAVDQLGGSWALALPLGVVAVVATRAWLRAPSSAPVVDLLRAPALALPLLALGLLASAMGVMVFSLPYFVDEVMGRDPDTFGLAMLCFVATAAVVSPVAGWLADRYSPERVAAAGGTLMVLGLFSLLSLGADAELVDLAWRLAALGGAMALFNSPTVAAIMKATPAGSTGTSGGVSMLSRTLGSTVGPALAAAAWNLRGGGTAGLDASVFAVSVLVVAGVGALLLTDRLSRPVPEPVAVATARPSRDLAPCRAG